MKATTKIIVDSYDQFLKGIGKDPISDEGFIKWGLKHVKMGDASDAYDSVCSIIDDINNKKNRQMYIRCYGKDKNGDAFKRLYEKLWPEITIKIDGDNNHEPNKCICENVKCNLSGKAAFNNEWIYLQNYQCAHIFGRTKNPILFTALFNLSLIPKLYDPLTGHETKGMLSEMFVEELSSKFRSVYKESIEKYEEFRSKEYGKIISAAENLPLEEFSEKRKKFFMNRVEKEWSQLS